MSEQATGKPADANGRPSFGTGGQDALRSPPAKPVKINDCATFSDYLKSSMAAARQEPAPARTASAARFTIRAVKPRALIRWSIVFLGAVTLVFFSVMDSSLKTVPADLFGRPAIVGHALRKDASSPAGVEAPPSPLATDSNQARFPGTADAKASSPLRTAAIAPSLPVQPNAASSETKHSGPDHSGGEALQIAPAPGPNSFNVALAAGEPRALFERAVHLSRQNDADSLAKAANYYRQAADKKFIPALFRLGLAYDKGLGVPMDKAKAASLYEEAARSGNIKAMHNLAVLSMTADSGNPDYVKAAEWFHVAADSGLADSQFNYAILLSRGLGVSKNPADAFRYFTLAAQQGDVIAAAQRENVARLIGKDKSAAIEIAVRSFVPVKEPAEANENTLPAAPWGTLQQP